MYKFDMSIPLDQSVDKLDNDKALTRSTKGKNKFKGARRRIQRMKLL